MAFPVTLNGRTYTLTDFEGTNYVDGLPDAFEDFVTHAGDIYNSTSTTSNSIGTGSKTFTVEANKPYQAGTPLRIADAAAPSTNFLDTVVTSYSGTTLVVNSIGYGGSGTKTSWTVNIGGAKTIDGTLGLSQGGTGATTAAGARTNIDVYSKSEADTRYLNISGDTDDISFTGSLTINDDLLHLQTTNATTGNTIVRIEGGTSGFSQIHFADADDNNAGRITFDHSSNEMQFFNTAQNFTMDTNGNTKFGAISGVTITGLSSGNNLIAGSPSGAEIVAYNSLNAVSLGDFVGAFLFGNDDNNTTEDHFAGMWAKSAGTTGAVDIHFAAGKANYETDSPHMTLDFNGHLLVGTTDASIYDDATDEAGHNLLANGQYYNSAVSEINMILNKQNGDGDIVQFRRDGATVGSIGSIAGDILTIGSGTSGFAIIGEAADAYPARIIPRQADGTSSNGLIDLGDSGARYRDLYLSGGVYLGGTGASNLLNSYEEGTWTPTIDAQTTSPTVTYGDRTGRYTKVGNMVTLWADIQPTISGGSGEATITGLPFAVTSADIRPVGAMEGRNINLSSGYTFFYVFSFASNTKLYFRQGGDNITETGIAIGNIGPRVGFTFTYMTDA